MNSLDLAYLPIALLSAPFWARKARSDWPGRFGRTARLDAPSPARKRLLIHAVSVGEVNTLRGLIPILNQHAEVVLSVGTDTGIASARALFADDSARASPSYLGPERIVRYPLDLSSAVRRFLDAVRPDAVALVELELWPNFVRECARREVPIAVINGRLSARSFRGYSRLRAFFRPTFQRLAFAAVQDRDYADRFLHMGVPGDRLHITGSMKWDSVHIREPHEQIAGAAALAAALGIDLNKPLIVAGSTGPLSTLSPGDQAFFTAAGSPFVGDGRSRPSADLGEEHLLALARPQVEDGGHGGGGGVQLLCAPRKPERFDAAFTQLGGRAGGGAAQCIRRSQTISSPSAATPSPARPVAPQGQSPSLFLLDTIGELRAAYSLATVAVIGRSFGALHGSDPIEPVSLGIPTVIGPRYADFHSIVATLKAADAIEIATIAELPAVLRRLINDPERRAQLAANGLACIRANQGATQRHADMLLALLAATPSARQSPAAVPVG